MLPSPFNRLLSARRATTQRRRITSAACVAVIAIATSAVAQDWEFAPSMPTPKANTFAINDNGAIYMVGGSPWANGEDEDGTVYKLGNGVWSEVSPLTGMGPVVGQGGGVDGLGRIIVFGGLKLPENDIAESRGYDPDEGPYFTVPDPPITDPPTNFGLAVDSEGRIYRMGGGPGATGFNYGSCLRYVGETNSWEPLAYLPFTRASIASAYDGIGHIWGFGGYTSFGMPRLVQTIRYTIATDTWDTIGSLFLPVAMSNGEAVLGADGRLYIIGGFEGYYGFTPSGTVRILDPAAVDPVLIDGPALNVPRYDFGAVLGDDGYIYVIGGYSAGGVALSSVERLYTGAAGLEGDLDLDGDVDGADLGLLLASWGPCDGCSADLNLDGLVDGADLGLLLANWSR